MKRSRKRKRRRRRRKRKRGRRGDEKRNSNNKVKN
jgi:hypothetical protein